MFLLGTMGLLYQQYQNLQTRCQRLQEMNQVLLNLHQSIAKMHLPVLLALKREQVQEEIWRQQYFGLVDEEMNKRDGKNLQLLFYEALPLEIKRVTRKEERRLFVSALCALFLVDSPGEDGSFLAYYEEFSDMLKKENHTKKERQKVTVCTTGMGLLVLFMLLL